MLSEGDYEQKDVRQTRIGETKKRNKAEHDQRTFVGVVLFLVMHFHKRE